MWKYNMFAILLLFFLSQSVTADIYKLSDSDYALMPPIFQMDPYEACFDDPEGFYCIVELNLVSDEPSPILTMIQEYSAYINIHYNHTRLQHGICITRTCKKFFETNKDLRSTLEACTNESLYTKYKLKAKVLEDFNCSTGENDWDIDILDLTVAAICIVILCANIVGSFCDYWFLQGKYYRCLRFIFAFSIFRNWKKLVAPQSDDRDPRLQQLKGLHGVRVLNMCLVIIAHACLVNIMMTENPEYIEYHIFMSWPYHIFFNGTVIMQTFLLISAFLLIYNWLIYSEKQKPSWRMVPKIILMRWLRLTPPYAVILALTSTWFGRILYGPYWQKTVYNEISDCRRDWWKHLLYINNYFDHSECMGQSWYLAVDMQLHLLGIIVFLISRNIGARKKTLTVLFVIGLIIPTAHTYLQDLSGVLIISPEIILTVFVGNSSFDEVYKRGHTNLTGFVLGMAMAYMIYDWQKANDDPKKMQKYRYLVWISFPLACLCCYSGSMFYAETAPPRAVHLLYAAFLKPIFGILIGTIIVGVIMQVEGVYRGILEWPGWVTPSRLSFSAYLIHVAVIRNYIALQNTTKMTSIIVIVLESLMLLLASFIAGFFFWILVEAPFDNIVKKYLTTSQKEAQGSQGIEKGSKREVTKAINGKTKEE